MYLVYFVVRQEQYEILVGNAKYTVVCIERYQKTGSGDSLFNGLLPS
jgi:hypothetical protein